MQKLTCTLFLTILCCLTLFGNTLSSNLTIEIFEQEDVECFGEDSGYLELEASDGTAPYTYDLDGETNMTGVFEDLTGGTYTLIVTDQLGCSTTMDIEIGEPDELEINVLETNDTGCSAATNGSFQLEGIGGSGSYIYTLGNEVNMTGLFENLAAGDYETLVEDANGCETLIVVTIGTGSGIGSAIVTQTNVDCFGNNTGEVQVEGLDGSAPYQYRIGATVNMDGIFTSLSVGTYTVLITDNAGCSTTQNINITEPNELTASVAGSTDVSCFGANDGSFQIMATGGTTDYNFSTANDSNSDGVFTNQSPGTYNVMVTDANGCMTMVMVTISEPAEIVVTNPVVTNVDCFGNMNGVIEIAATGGTGNISYTLGAETNTTGVFSGLSGGNYTIVVMDGSGCEVSVAVTVGEPDELVGIIDAIFNINCAGSGTGSVDFGAMGGTPDFTFTLNGVSNNDGFFDNLVAGDYTATIVDANNCQTTVMATIEESDGLGVNVLNLMNVSCNGEMDGSVLVAANGGSGNYTYMVNGETNSTGVFSSLAPGLYEGFATDDMDCSTMFEFTITEPAVLTFTVEVVMPIACAGNTNGAIQITAMGGNADYTYSIGLQNNQTGLFENLSAGTFSISVADANGCMVMEDFILEEPTPLEIVIPNFGAVSCAGGNDGFIQAMGMGGTGDYTYTLGDNSNATGLFENLEAGSYDVSVEDDNGCIASTQFTVSAPNEVFGFIAEIQNSGCNMILGFVQIEGGGGTGALTYTLDMETNMTGLFEDLEGGMYEVVVMDENGCSATVEVIIEEGDDLTAVIEMQEDAECFGESSGFVEITSTGGAGGVTYTLGDETNSTGLFEDLPAGSYEITVSSAGGCIIMIPVEIGQPDMMEFEAMIIEAPLCAESMDGSIQVTATGGSGNYLFTLDGGAMNETGLFENLGAGTYDVLVADENECSVNGEITIVAPAPLIVTVADILPDTGGPNGSFNATGSGGVAPYEYSLDGVNFQSEGAFTNLLFGDYTLTIMDANGCVTTVDVTVPFMSNTYSVESGVAGMKVFPNPFVDNLTIELDLYRGQELQLTIFNISGVHVQSMQQNFGAGKSNLTIPSLENLTAGTYFLRVVGADFQGHYKIVKAN